MGKKKGLIKSMLPWLVVVMVMTVAIPFFNQESSSEISYNEFTKVVQEEKITEVEIVPSSLVIDVEGAYTKKGNEKETKFTVVIPKTETELDSLIELLDENGTKVTIVDENDRGLFLDIILTLLPYVLLIGAMFFFVRMMSNTAGGNNKAF